MRTWKKGLTLLMASAAVFSLGGGFTCMAEEKEYELADAQTPADADFSCIISESGEVVWKMNVTTFDKLAKDLPEESNYIKVEVLPQSEEAYPYLYPDSEWKLFILEDQVPEWFTDEYKEKVMAAFEEWKEEAYSKIDLDALFHIADPRNAQAKEPAEEEISTMIDWIDTYNYVSAYPRTATLDTVVSAVGTSLGHDAWNYVSDTVWDEVMEAAPVNEIVEEMTGKKAAGEKQESMLGALVGSAFTGIAEWKYYVGSKEGYPYQAAIDLLTDGYLVSFGGGTWRLHSVSDGGAVVYELEEVPSSNAFACVAAEDGTIYSRVGLDFCDGIIAENNLDEANTVKINVLPDDYTDPDGNWTVTVLNEEVPEWYSEDMEADVMDAFAVWKETVYAVFDYKTIKDALTDAEIFGTARMEVPEEAREALKKWAVLWNEAVDNGYKLDATIGAAAWDVVGTSIWNSTDGQILANYKQCHEGCPGPTTSPVLSEYLGGEMDSARDDAVGDTISDGYAAYRGSFIEGICTDENGDYLYQPAADLWNMGYIPMSDGNTWWLLTGPDGDVQVAYEASNAELLAE
ncbi:MAG: hypothetical protein PHE06_01160 [Lachnospiraceae bacterium]|nr:hypothetical protein [Lachnospiraceae bacterium]